MGAKGSRCFGKQQLYNDYYQPTDASFSNHMSKSREIGKDNFKILKVLGKGAFGKVFLVEKKDTRELLAMKVLNKANVIETNQVEHTKTERIVMQYARSPFVINLHYAFQTDSKLYIVMDYLNGGELYYHLKKEKKFNEDRIRFYSSEIVLALEALHKEGIIYRDMKPENILLDSDGHIRLTDFGLSKQGNFKMNEDQTFTICGTPSYLAPEIIRQKGHGKAVDWWGLGILLYEMYLGAPPFTNHNEMQILADIINTKIDFGRIKSASDEFRDLVQQLLEHDPMKRLGGGESDAFEVKMHPFFKSVNWDHVNDKKIEVPFKPEAKDPRKTSNFDKMMLKQTAMESIAYNRIASPQPHTSIHFERFSFSRDNDFELNNTQTFT